MDNLGIHLSVIKFFIKMKIYLKILAVFMLIVSCQDKSISEDSEPKTLLTEGQFNDFFPKEIGDYKLTNVSVLMSSAIASALYVEGNDYDHTMTYSLEDGYRKGSAIIRNFEDSYNLKLQGPAGTEYIYKERDGYKTIAFLQPNINRNDIRFIYNNRFRLTLDGIEDVSTLWSYFKKEDLQKLNKK